MGGTNVHVVLEENEEAMRESWRHPYHAGRLRRELDSGPLFEGGRTPAKIDRHVPDCTSYHVNQFSLRLPYLVMQTSQNVLSRARHVVLDEFHIKPYRLPKNATVVNFHEPAPRVAKPMRLEHEHIRNGGGRDFHKCPGSARTFNRYSP